MLYLDSVMAASSGFNNLSFSYNIDGGYYFVLVCIILPRSRYLMLNSEKVSSPKSLIICSLDDGSRGTVIIVFDAAVDLRTLDGCSVTCVLQFLISTSICCSPFNSLAC